MKKIIFIFLFIFLVLLITCSSDKSKREKVLNDFKSSVEDKLDVFGNLDKYEVSGRDVTIHLLKEYDDMKEKGQIRFINKVCDIVFMAASDSGIYQIWDTVYVKVYSFDGKYLDTYLVERDSNYTDLSN